ncbi:hypothetical protein [Ectothiorhodospira haloalkaliphila]|nr:hypothetical protein [Ectothiorhodospira haloalkaliphila]
MDNTYLLHQLLQASARRTPDAPAVTYGKLDRKSLAGEYSP